MEITKLTVSALSECLKKRELNSAEITAAYLSRIAEGNPGLNAYVTVAGESAAQTAAQSDENRDIHPLAGIPYALKDNFASRGTRMTCASRILENFVPFFNSFMN